MSPKRSGTRWVLLLALVLFVWNLWGSDLAAPDEPYFAEGAREMVVDGQWGVPHVNGTITTDKPPLFFWLIALFSLPFGHVSSFTARLPSALAMLGATALVVRLGRRLLDERAGQLAGTLFATNYLVWDKARSSQIDALLCCLILVALSAFVELRAGASGRAAGLLFWLACALAVLAKGPVGVLLPVGIALVTLAWDRDLGAWKRFAPWTGPLLFALVVGAWMVMATLSGHGEYSVLGAFKEHVLNRAVHGMHHRQPPWYYLHVLPVQLLPWSGLVPGALVLAGRRRSAAERLLLAWALFVVLFFTLSTEKRDLYVLPAYPAFMLLAASFVTAMEQDRAPLARRWLTWPQGTVTLLLIVVGIAIPLAAKRFAVVPLPSATILGALLAVTGVAGAFALWRGRVSALLRRTMIGISLAYLITATLVLPALDPVRSARSFAEVVRRDTADSRAHGHEVVAFDLGNFPEALAYYSNGVYLRETSDAAALATHLSQAPRVFAVTREQDLALLPEELRARLVVVETGRLGGEGALLVSNQPAPEPTR